MRLLKTVIMKALALHPLGRLRSNGKGLENYRMESQDAFPQGS